MADYIILDLQILARVHDSDKWIWLAGRSVDIMRGGNFCVTQHLPGDCLVTRGCNARSIRNASGPRTQPTGTAQGWHRADDPSSHAL
jgi:hypothetical protein